MGKPVKADTSRVKESILQCMSSLSILETAVAQLLVNLSTPNNPAVNAVAWTSSPQVLLLYWEMHFRVNKRRSVTAIEDKGTRWWARISGTWSRDVGWQTAVMGETCIRVRLDVGQRLSRFEVEIRRNQWKRGASDW